MSGSLADRVRAVVIELFLDGDTSFPIDPGMSLIENGICDSMGLVNLAAALEQRFPGLRIQDQDVTPEQMGSVEAIAAFIQRRGVAA